MELTKEQEKVLQSNVKDLVVSASAGSGKTFVVIEKLIGLICDKKVPVERLLVLTFTKAASNEMKSRLYNAILEKPSSKFLLEQIDSLPLSDISTIDSFCEKIIKRNINKLDLDENFVILDEKTSIGLKKLAFSRTFQYFSQNENEKFEEIYFAFKRNKQSFEDCIFALQEYLASCENQENYLNDFENSIAEKSKLAEEKLCDKIMQSLRKAEGFLKQVDKSLLNKNSEKIFAGLKEFTKLDCKDLFILSQKLNNMLPLPAFRGKIEEEVKTLLSKAKDSIKEAAAITENYIFLPAEARNQFEEGKLIKAIIAFYKHYIKLYSGLKNKRDGLDFADIEYYAMQLLQDEEIKKGLQEKYDYIFIDEYQDTNRLQQSIIKPISEGGYFVAVGDLKQGIYGFRNARMEIMQEDIENFSKSPDGEALFLTGNFRTDKNILDFVNIVFEKVMTTESVGINYKKTSLLKGLRHFEDGQMPAVAVDVVVKTKETQQESEELQSKIYSVKEDAIQEDEKFKNEILAIQNRIEESLASQIYDAKLGRYRKVNFSDITLLFRNRSALMHQTYKTLNKKGFPINADIKEQLLDDGEVGVIYSLLKLTLNMHDDIALVSVMNSHFGSFSIEELSDLRIQEKEKIPYYQIIEESENVKVKEFKEMISCFRFEIQIFGVIKALNRIFNKYEYFHYLQSLSDGSEKLTYINSLFKIIRSSNLDNNVSAIITQLEGVKENSGSGGGNAITMTTIHATKGLEYPIVILCGAGENLNKTYAQNYVISEKFGFASYINDFENMIRTPSPAYIAGKMEKQDREFIDEIMIFYVALTRAQNHLFIIGSGKEKDFSFDNLTNQNSYLKMIFYALGENLTSQIFNQEKLVKGKWEFNVFDEFEEVTSAQSKIQISSIKFAQEISDYNNFQYENKKICKIGLKNSVTGTTKLNEEKEIFIHHTEENEITSQNAQLAIDRGNAYHEALKLLDFDKINNIEQLSTQLNTISPRMSEGYYQLLNKQLLLKNILIIKKLCQNRKLYKEKEFIMKASLSEIGLEDLNQHKNEKTEESVIVQGIVDLFAVGEDIVLVDYKFSSLSCENLKVRYARQIELYSMALEKAFGKKIEKRYLLSLKDAKVIDM